MKSTLGRAGEAAGLEQHHADDHQQDHLAHQEEIAEQEQVAERRRHAEAGAVHDDARDKADDERAGDDQQPVTPSRRHE